MEKYFAPEIIVALITGIISIFTLFLKTNRESKLSRITDERTKWREGIRTIAEKISVGENSHKQEETLSILLTELKVRINPYGRYKNSYLKDSHIWNCISNIENCIEKDKDADKVNVEKKKLINYLSLLLKYDWERSKKESSLNLPVIIGYSLYVVSNVLFAYFAYTEFTDATLYWLIVLILVFAVYFFLPSVLMSLFKLINSDIDFSSVIVAYGTALFVLIGLIIKCNLNTSEIQLGTLNLPILLQIIALSFLLFSKLNEAKLNSNYIKSIESCEPIKINKRVNNTQKNKKETKVKVQKKTKNIELKKYSFIEVVVSPVIFVWHIIVFVFKLLWFLILLFGNLFYGVSELLKHSMDNLFEKLHDK